MTDTHRSKQSVNPETETLDTKQTKSTSTSTSTSSDVLGKERATVTATTAERWPALFVRIREQLLVAGTNLETNDVDAIGDGDQSPITRPEEKHIYEELFQSGGEFDTLFAESSSTLKQDSRSSKNSVQPLSEFARHCVHGRSKIVGHMLERNSVRQGKRLDTLIDVLERRETPMRYSSLLLVFVALRKLGRDQGPVQSTGTATATSSLPVLLERDETIRNSDHNQYDIDTEQRDDCEEAAPKAPSKPSVPESTFSVEEQNLLKVVSVLLSYGARPDARDVLGRTVCFYGAGVDATEASLLATSMCLGAAVSAHCFGREIRLRDMTEKAYNGLTGIAAGYQTDTARRTVYLFGKRSEVHVRNRNIRLVDNGEPSSNEPSSTSRKAAVKNFNLCDVQDRLGRVCMVELFHSKRVDVAAFLLHKHEASIDIPDWHGDTLRAITLLRGHAVSSTVAMNDQSRRNVAEFLASEVMKRARTEQRKGINNCSECGKLGAKDSPLRVCEPCMSVRYCSHACQASHWKCAHRKECAELRKVYFESVTIDKPSTRKGDVADNAILTFTEGTVPMTSYRRPGHVAIGELFTVKVQRVSGRNTLIIYDKSRECEFCLGPDKKAYKNLLQKVQAEHATAGTKTYMSASFDKKGNCTLYLNQTKMKMW